jgi:hypothetical protein
MYIHVNDFGILYSVSCTDSCGMIVVCSLVIKFAQCNIFQKCNLCLTYALCNDSDEQFHE